MASAMTNRVTQNVSVARAPQRFVQPLLDAGDALRDSKAGNADQHVSAQRRIQRTRSAAEAAGAKYDAR